MNLQTNSKTNSQVVMRDLNNVYYKQQGTYTIEESCIIFESGWGETYFYDSNDNVIDSFPYSSSQNHNHIITFNKQTGKVIIINNDANSHTSTIIKEVSNVAKLAFFGSRSDSMWGYFN